MKLSTLQNWKFPATLWLAATIALALVWRICLTPAGAARMPFWFVRMAQLTGSVVYDDPVLALRIQISRLLLIATAASGVWIATIEKQRLGAAIGRLLNQESDPLNLAIFRIVVFWQIYNEAYFDLISRVASLPDGLQYPPQTGIPGVWFLKNLAHWPLHTMSPAAIGVAGEVMKWGAVIGALGLFSRTCAAVVSALFLVAWGRLQWYGKVDHVHHLVWFALLLAVSPCGDILSVDWLIAKWRGRKTPGPGRQYGMPLAFVMILMGVIYLFPGLWKFCRSGLDWSLSDSPRLMMYQEWRLYGDWLPSFRFDQHPWLYHAGALGTQIFELSFLFLLLGRWTRILAGVMGFSFHWMTNITLNIGFESLRNCYVVFVDWGRIFRRGLAVSVRPPSSLRPITATAAVGAFLVAGNLWAGAIRAMDGWPLACYPPFDGLSQPYYRTARMDLTMEDGSHRTIVPDEFRTVYGNGWNNLLQRILQTRDESQRREKLRRIWNAVGKTDPVIGAARHVRFYSVRSFVDPSRWHEEPDDPQFLYEADVGP